MTQVTLNTLNNLENMLTKHNEVSKKIDTLTSGMDKSTNFKEILDGKFEKISSTIEDVKQTSKDVELADLAVFRETLKQITDEANVETSLDLTLAKDINEIISQLKEAVENATEMVEKTAEAEVIVDENTDGEADVEAGTGSVDLITQLGAVLQEASKEFAADDTKKTEVETKNIYEQVLSFVNGKTELNSETNKIEIPQEKTIDTKNIELNQSEFFEIVENLADEVVAKKETEASSISDIDLAIDEEILKELKIEKVQAEVDTSVGENLMQNQTPEEQGVKAMLTQEIEGFEVKLETSQISQSSQATQTAQVKAADVNPSRIIDQITKHLEALQNNSKVNIVLNPESLGKVNIQLLTTKEGLSAQFTVATQEARELLMKGLDGLKETLVSHGVGVDNVSVKVADAQKSEYNSDWTEQEGSRGGNKEQNRQDRQEKEKGLFERLMAQTQEKENGNV